MKKVIVLLVLLTLLVGCGPEVWGGGPLALEAAEKSNAVSLGGIMDLLQDGYAEYIALAGVASLVQLVVSFAKKREWLKDGYADIAVFWLNVLGFGIFMYFQVSGVADPATIDSYAVSIINVLESLVEILGMFGVSLLNYKAFKGTRLVHSH